MLHFATLNWIIHSPNNTATYHATYYADGNLPLHYAVRAAKVPVIKYLLEKGVWVEGSDSKDDTPLHIAARQASKPEHMV